MKGKIKEFFDGDMDADDGVLPMGGEDHNDDFIDDEATEINLVAAEPTKVVGKDGTIVLVSAGDAVNIVSESKVHKISKETK
jgi:hypothetical protein